MRKVPLTLLACAGMFTGLPQAVPRSMDIGTFAIDDYAGNGGGLPNLSYQVSLAANFFDRAVSIVPGYLSYYSLSPSRSPTHPLNKQNDQVTKTAAISTSSAYGSREYCDMVFYAGHGVKASPGVSPSLFLGGPNSSPYGRVHPADLSMGGSGKYNRWFIGHACNLFPRPPFPSPASTWNHTFKGLKAMLGFESYIFDNFDGWQLFHAFWINWTWNNMGLWDSFLQAETNHGYKNLGYSGIHPGCLSASGADYCSESFRTTANNYSPANPGAGVYYSHKVGSPDYPYP